MEKNIIKTEIEVKETNPVPQVDINSPLKAPIKESTEYETGVTPKNKTLYALGIFGFIGITFLVLIILFLYLKN
jgi:hypothetical protein